MNTPEHWLVETARTEKTYAGWRIIDTVRLQFIGSVKTLSEMGTMKDVKELVAALKTAEAIAKERQP